MIDELLQRAERDGFNQVRRALIRRYLNEIIANIRMRIEPLHSFSEDGHENYSLIHKQEVLNELDEMTNTSLPHA
jgi:hypothetical protein